MSLVEKNLPNNIYIPAGSSEQGLISMIYKTFKCWLFSVVIRQKHFYKSCNEGTDTDVIFLSWGPLLLSAMMGVIFCELVKLSPCPINLKIIGSIKVLHKIKQIYFSQFTAELSPILYTHQILKQKLCCFKRSNASL